MIDIAGESLIFRRAGFSPALSLLMPTFAFHAAPVTLAGDLRRWQECSPTGQFNTDPTASVDSLMPVYYPRGIARLVSCYALFK